MNRNEALAKAGLSVFTENHGQPPEIYADAQMAKRGTAYITGSFKDTGRKIVEAKAVNDVALVVLVRVTLGEKSRGYQIVAYDLAGNVIDETPLNDSAPKGKSKGYSTFGAMVKAISKRDDLVVAAISAARESLLCRAAELAELLSEYADTAEVAEPTAETAEA